VQAAFFDMDRTLLRIDTAMSWMRFLYRRGELPLAMVAKSVYWSTLYKLAILDMDRVFTGLAADLRGDLESDMIAKAALWYRQDVASQVAPAARGAIARHKRAGHAVVLATGSTVYAARAAAADVGIEHVLASALEVDAGRFTGRASALCFGHHKVGLAERWAADHGVELSRSVFYSDSYNDLPLLARVGTAVAVNPDARLRRHARRVGWEIASW
jgi:HAD superfamily hydrolase (TIGR01490 family)